MNILFSRKNPLFHNISLFFQRSNIFDFSQKDFTTGAKKTFLSNIWNAFQKKFAALDVFEKLLDFFEKKTFFFFQKKKQILNVLRNFKQ